MNKTNTKNNHWIFFLLIVIAMYTYYIWLWKDFIFYDGKAGWKGFGLFINTLYTSPIYIVFHIAAYFIARSAGAKKVMMVSLAGMIACIIHICAVVATL